MTVSDSTARRFTIGSIVAKAYRYAGLLEADQEPRSADGRLGRELLEDIVDQLSTEGVQARAMTFDEVTLTADTYKYDLSATVLDVLDPAMYIDASESDTSKASGETTIRIVTQQQWHETSAKNATGRPSRAYIHRVDDTVEAWLWPIPDEAGTVRFRVQRHLADTDDDNATLDLQPYWYDYIKTELACQIAEAKSMPDGKVMRLSAKAARLLQKAKGKANQRPAPIVRLEHTTGYHR